MPVGGGQGVLVASLSLGFLSVVHVVELVAEVLGWSSTSLCWALSRVVLLAVAVPRGALGVRVQQPVSGG
jgi:hypothetical protein